MSDETKKPLAGEYWFPKSGKPYLCLASNSRGESVWSNADEHYFAFNDGYFWKHWHHEPRCDSFDWVEPPAVDPGEGYELLPVGTVLQEGDQYKVSYGWRDTKIPRCKVEEGDEYRRKIKPVATGTVKLTPVCDYRGESPDGKKQSTARWTATTSGPRFGAEIPDYKGETPDDWVTLPPDHVLRREVDWFCTYMQSSKWDTVCDSAGLTVAQVGFKAARCRRKDLPVAAPAVKRIPVRLWVRYDLNYSSGHMYVFADSSHPVGAGNKYAEIHSDGNGGWYVKTSSDGCGAKEQGPVQPIVMSCPFCGGTKVNVIEGGTFRWRRAECQECEAMAGAVRIQTTGDGTDEEWEKNAADEAIKRWNERA